MNLAVVWHEIECHGYDADLGLWLELARVEQGPVLDVGAGTGRVAVPLAYAGHDVTALDIDGDLLAALPREIPTVTADAQAFDLDRRFGLLVVPMQTVQLLDDRAAFLRAARRHLLPGGLLAAAVAEDFETFDVTVGLPFPDVGEREGWRFSSQPTALRSTQDGVRIERVRTAWRPDGRRSVEPDVIELNRLTAAQLEVEARARGFTPEPAREIAPTPDHVGTTVVMLRG